MKISRTFYVHTGLFILLFFISNLLSAQNIQLLDAESKMPISGAHLIVGNSVLTSNNEGQIELRLDNYTVKDGLQFSHQSYGRFFLSEEQLERLRATSTLFLSRQAYAMAPVSVIAVRASSPNTQTHFSLENDLLQHDATELAMQNPSVNGIRKSGGYGFDPVLRGFKYDRLNIVQGGVQSAMAACPNRMDPPTSQMSVNAIEKLEIIKGPYALRYGVGLGGTLNFETAQLSQSAQTKSFGRFSSAYESNGQIGRSEAKVGIGNEKRAIALFGAWSEGQDYQSGNDTDIAAGFSRANIGLQAEWMAKSEHRFEVHTQYNWARNTDFAALPMDLRSDDTWMLRAKHSYQGKQWQLNTAVFASIVDHTMDNLGRNLQPRMVNAITNAQTSVFGARSEARFEGQKRITFVGIDIKQEQAEGTRSRELLMGPMAGNILFDNVWQDGQITRSALFAEHHQELSPRTQFTLSSRAEYTQADALKPVDSTPAGVQEQWGLSLATGLEHQLNNRWSLALWASRTQRSAGMSERFINFFPIGVDPYEIVGNQQLDVETNWQSDLSIAYAQSTFQSQLNLFYSVVDDFIAAYVVDGLQPRMMSSPGVRQFQNIGQAERYGAEFQLDWQMNRYFEHHLSMAYTYAQDLELNEPLPEIAPLDLRYHLRIAQNKAKLSHRLSLRHVVQQDRISPSFGEIATPSFTTIDWQTRYQLHAKVGLTLQIQNLFNEQYFEHLNRMSALSNTPIFAPGRNVVLTASYQF